MTEWQRQNEESLWEMTEWREFVRDGIHFPNSTFLAMVSPAGWSEWDQDICGTPRELSYYPLWLGLRCKSRPKHLPPQYQIPRLSLSQEGLSFLKVLTGVYIATGNVRQYLCVGGEHLCVCVACVCQQSEWWERLFLPASNVCQNSGDKTRKNFYVSGEKNSLLYYTMLKCWVMNQA